MELLKLILDQAAGVAIAILLIMRIENKLDGLTDAVNQLASAIKSTHKEPGVRTRQI
ncbi:YvrJ family protein [Lactobacillus sp. ESL0791]|uniref:YvrJ family protein n=1 Tax=Lactobacillus sp. ESL0791 TaxID=2983234 RepID=UPI0023F6CAB5|nr:YvrJ family protein [Lactobacillus sp. ESL0791]MDF7639985.1 YvrJ family protein [Lactobacillus sp. ESL0791]